MPRRPRTFELFKEVRCRSGGISTAVSAPNVCTRRGSALRGSRFSFCALVEQASSVDTANANPALPRYMYESRCHALGVENLMFTNHGSHGLGVAFPRGCYLREVH